MQARLRSHGEFQECCSLLSTDTFSLPCSPLSQLRQGPQAVMAPGRGSGEWPGSPDPLSARGGDLLFSIFKS